MSSPLLKAHSESNILRKLSVDKNDLNYLSFSGPMYHNPKCNYMLYIKRSWKQARSNLFSN